MGKRTQTAFETYEPYSATKPLKKEKLIMKNTIVLFGCILAVLIVFIFTLMSNPLSQQTQNPNIFFPLGVQIQTKHAIEDNNLLISYSVEKIDKNNYLYVYKLIYQGKKHYLFQWDILDKALNSKTILNLSPNSSHEFKIKSSIQPTFVMGKSNIMEQSELNTDNIKSIIWRSLPSKEYVGPLPQENAL